MSLERFMKVYAFLPIEERKLTVIVLDDEPVNWKRAYEEIRVETALGKRILGTLMERGLI